MQLSYQDSQADPKQSVLIAQKFADDSTILAELGDFASPASNVITLLSPYGEDDAQKTLAEEGEGPFALGFRVRNLDQTRHYLERQAIAFKQINSSKPRIILDPAETSGIRIHLVQ